MTQQGKTLTTEQKISIVNLKKCFDLEREAGKIVSTKDPTGRVAKGLGIGRRTIETVLAEYNKNDQTVFAVTEKVRGKPPFCLSNDLIPHIRH